MAGKPTGDVEILAVTKAWKFRGDARALVALLGTIAGLWGGWTLGRQQAPEDVSQSAVYATKQALDEHIQWSAAQVVGRDRRLDAIDAHLVAISESASSVQADLREVRSMLLQLGARASHPMVPSHTSGGGGTVTLAAASARNEP